MGKLEREKGLFLSLSFCAGLAVKRRGRKTLRFPIQHTHDLVGATKKGVKVSDQRSIFPFATLHCYLGGKSL